MRSQWLRTDLSTKCPANDVTTLLPFQVPARPSRVLRGEGRVSPHGSVPAGPARPLRPEPQLGLPQASSRWPPRGHPPQPQEALVHVGAWVPDGG